MSDGVTEWPQEVRIGGRTFEVSPDMTLADYTEVSQRLENEVQPLIDVARSLGIDMDSFGGDAE